MVQEQSDAFDIALGHLQSLAGPGAGFHDDQFEAIEALVERRERLLLVKRTGWGKSGVYFIATRMLRDAGGGPTLLVSPLLALMRDQIRAAESLGLNAATINSTNTDEWAEVYGQLKRDEVDLLLISPERLNNPEFREKALGDVLSRVGLLVVDEAHCISDWGHDFRPDYRRIKTVVTLLPRTVPVLLTTATANNRVIADVVEQLGDHLQVLRGPLKRDSLRLGVLNLPNEVDRLAWLAATIPELPGSGIVYCLTVPATRTVADWLTSRGISAAAYSGQDDDEVRLKIEEELAGNDIKVVVATSALGMGYDKPDLAWVIHYQAPGSPVFYYQQVGRAGRQLDKAYAILMRGREDADIQDFFITTAFPAEEEADAVLAAVSQEPLKLGQIAARLNLREGKVAAFLKILEVEQVVARDHGYWSRTINPWTYPRERVEGVTAARRNEQAAMTAYAEIDSCYMELLTEILNDPQPEPCGHCANCEGYQLDPTVPKDMAIAAEAYLGRLHVPLEPRRLWPSGLSQEHQLEKLKEYQLEEGYALCRYGSAVWGDAIHDGKYVNVSFSPELVEALADIVSGRLDGKGIQWITHIPSLKRPHLVADFAAAVAARLGITHIPLLAKRDNAQQKAMQNSFRQAANAIAGLELSGTPPTAPGLLLDDIVSSRWTLTVAGYLLRSAGSGPLYPVVLADASHWS
ncbi:MAG: RecQ family ATP-dependent DNA helicase [Acidimicrobiia bacterium]|nr:RecQ family ATP-dependent DNA helicase [Acidimicrobiia bacterium]